MTIRYVGPGGSNSNNGLTWATRKLTLNGVEDTPVQAGDTVYVGPGTYRETLTCDVSGTSGSPISYIGDYSGAHTDGVGGVVRVTGSDNDQTAVRGRVFDIYNYSYRTFRGFVVDLFSGHGIFVNNGNNAVIDQCYIMGSIGGSESIRIYGTGKEHTISNCVFSLGASSGTYIRFSAVAAVDDTGSAISNCLFLPDYGYNGVGVWINYHGGVTIKNSTFFGLGKQAVYQENSATAGQITTVNNCLFVGCTCAFQGLNTSSASFIAEDYNNLWGNSINRQYVNVGAHSTAYPPLFDTRWFFELVGGGRMLSPWDLSSYSTLLNVAGTSPTSTDARGTSKIGAEREWGLLEYDSTLKLKDSGGSGGSGISRSRLIGGV